MANAKLVKKLDEWGIDYELLKHKTVFTAHDVAATLKKKFDEIAKTLIVQADKDFYFIAVPGDKNIDMEKLKKAIKKAGGSVKKISIPTEKIITAKLNVRPGKITGFGSLHNLPVIMDKDLSKKNKVVFSAGDVTESIWMKMKDYLKIEEPAVEIIGVKRKFKTVKVSPKKIKKVPVRKLKNVRMKKLKNVRTKKRKNVRTKVLKNKKKVNKKK